MTNPILNEINGLSPGAKTALLNAHQANSAPTPAAPIVGLHAPSQIPTTPKMGAPPPVDSAGLSAATATAPSLPAPNMGNMASSTAPRGTLQGEENEQSRLINTGSGIHQIKNPVLKGLAGVGNSIGSIVAPGLLRAIPGTEEHHNLLLGQNAGLIGEQQKVQGADLGNAQKQAEAANQTAQASEHAETTQEMPTREADLHAQSGATTANLQSETDARNTTAAQGPSLAAAYAHRVNEVLKIGGDPSQDPIVQHLGDAITSIQKQTAPKGAHFIQREIGGKPHTIAVDDATGADIRDEGPTGEKPPTVNVNEAHKEGIAQRGVIAKTYQPVMDSAERYNVMAKNYEDAVKNHDQQAMLSLLYNHMGMTMGLQKGARMTKDLIHEAQQSQPWLNGIKAHYDNQGYLSGVVLSPQQMQEMVSNARGRYSEDVVKARNEAKYLGATDDGPQRTPNQSVINYYTHLAGGNPQKAKQLAGADGWSVQ